jgi:hypothetical protein
MDRDSVVRHFRELCSVRFAARERSREQCDGRNSHQADRERVIGMLNAARTLGELVAVMYAEGWSYFVLLTFLAETSLPDVSGDEFDGLFPDERRRVPPERVGTTTTSTDLLRRLKEAWRDHLQPSAAWPQPASDEFLAATRLGEAFQALSKAGLSVDAIMRLLVEAQGATVRADEFSAWNDTVRFPLRDPQ